MKQKELAELLGISGAMVSRLVKRGMPTDSLERAERWRRRHLETGRMKGVRFGTTRTTPSTPSRAHSNELMQALDLLNVAAMAIEAGQSIAPMMQALREALHTVPEHERDAMLLPFNVMDALCADVLFVLTTDANSSTSGAKVNRLDDDESDTMGRFWYEVAAGEIRVS